MGGKKLIFLIFLSFTFIFSSLAFALEIGMDDGVFGIDLIPDKPINYSTVYVNSSNYADIWITTEGYKDDVSDISISEINIPLGTIANPSITPDSDTATGISFPESRTTCISGDSAEIVCFTDTGYKMDLSGNALLDGLVNITGETLTYGNINTTGNIYVPDGSVSSPVYSFLNYQDTGLFVDIQEDVETFNIAVNNYTAFQIDSGNYRFYDGTGTENAVIVGGSFYGNTLYHYGDLNTYLSFPVLGDMISIFIGGDNLFFMRKGVTPVLNDIIFNEGGEDYDIRMEGANDVNLFYTDGGNDRIGIGTSAPSHKLTVVGDMNITGLPKEPTTATSQYICWDIDGHLFLNETGC